MMLFFGLSINRIIKEEIEMDPVKIGLFIKEKRIQQVLTQEQLSEMLGISKNTVSRWERGISTPDISVLKDLAKALNITVEELLEGKANQSKMTDAGNTINSDDSQKQLKYQARNKLRELKEKLLIGFLCMSVIFTDILYGYSATKLDWDVNDRTIRPKGFLLRLLFGSNRMDNTKGTVISRMFAVVVTAAIIETLFLVAVILVFLKENENGNHIPENKKE